MVIPRQFCIQCTQFRDGKFQDQWEIYYVHNAPVGIKYILYLGKMESKAKP
jgi:hypothetical protein